MLFTFTFPGTCCHNLPTSTSKVQSSAHLHILTIKCWGTDSLGSFTCTVKSIGEMTDPWGTPAGHGFTDETESTSFTCWLLPSRKLQVHNQKLLVTCVTQLAFLIQPHGQYQVKRFMEVKKECMENHSFIVCMISCVEPVFDEEVLRSGESHCSTLMATLVTGFISTCL